MNNIINFLNNYYDKAIKLSNEFSVTRSFEWGNLLILNELSIQIGHIYNVVYKNDVVNEKDRIFDNLGDEISDVLLQLIALSDSLNLDLYEIKDMEMFDEKDWLSLPILFGQLNEAIMEKEGYRFSKPRKGFSNIDEFIKNRILRLFIITYNISLNYNLDIQKEFELMLEDANGFLARFSKKLEYISVYDDIHNFKGVVEKRKAHKLGLWHEVIGVLIFNPVTQNVYFQLKNHKNNVFSNDKDLLEITVEGHLKAGEDVKDTVREIKEQTGIEVSFEDLIPCLTRKCDMDNGMLIREFQNFYLLPMKVDLKDFNSDKVNGFIQMNLKDALNIVLYGIGLQNEMKIIKDNEIGDLIITRDDFDEMFLNNGVFYDLLNKTQEYIENRLLKIKLEKSIKRKLNRIFRVIKLDRFLHKKEYYSDNGKTEKFLEIYKDNITYTLVKNNEDISTNIYIVYVIIELNNKIATRQLMKRFSSEEEAEKYFKYLSEYINESSNEEIIQNCYTKLNEKSLFIRIFSMLG